MKTNGWKGPARAPSKRVLPELSNISNALIGPFVKPMPRRDRISRLQATLVIATMKLASAIGWYIVWKNGEIIVEKRPTRG